MSSYASMKNKLLPLGLYGFAEGSVTDKELTAYAAALDPLFDEMDEMIKEGFISTAESNGLSEREKFIDREKPQLTIARRRELLINQEKAVLWDGTAAGFNRFLSGCGLTDFRVDEFPTRQRVAIYINDDLNEGEKSLIGNKIAHAAPIHLNVQVYYRT